MGSAHPFFIYNFLKYKKNGFKPFFVKEYSETCRN